MRSAVKVFVCSILLSYFILYFLFQMAQLIKGSHVKNVSKQNRTKRILLWNGSGRKEVRVFGKGKDAFCKQKCDYTRCEILYNADHPMEHYDAIVVVFNDEFTSADQLRMPKFYNNRNPSQRLIFFTQESPPALKPYYNMSQLDDLFNWTMTYRMDADIPLLYGRIIPKENYTRTPEEISCFRGKVKTNKTHASIRKKTKTIAWMVSHCSTHSHRENYIKELMKHIDIDIYGECGKLSCARDILHHSDPQCYYMLQSTYKFYLSFENAICQDYVTEKFFKIMGHDIIPVVYGGADYSQHAPPHSFIDASNFKPKELASYLKEVGNNDAIYNEYFWWKEYYRVEFSVEDMSRHGFCGLCKKLHVEDGEFKSYNNLATEWSDVIKCKQFDSNRM